MHYFVFYLDNQSLILHFPFVLLTLVSDLA